MHLSPLRIGLASWLIAVTVGYVVLTREAGAAGESAASAPTSLPADLGLSRGDGRATVIMVVHPRCACSRASLAQLDRLLTRSSGYADAFVVFSPSQASAPDDMHAVAAKIAGVHMVDDVHGDLARRLGARTSGQLFVYQADGRLAYAGGITPGRGHEGDNDGFDAALRAARGEKPRTLAAAVFGCGIFNR